MDLLIICEKVVFSHHVLNNWASFYEQLT